MSGTVTISDQRSYIKIGTSRGKNPTEIHGGLKCVLSSQWTVVQFLVELIVFVMVM